MHFVKVPYGEIYVHGEGAVSRPSCKTAGISESYEVLGNLSWALSWSMIDDAASAVWTASRSLSSATMLRWIAGTGCVHTAPGFGADDFIVCQKYPEIPIIVPVDGKGHDHG